VSPIRHGRPRRRAARGFGLVELLIGMSLGMVVIGVAIGAFLSVKRTATALGASTIVSDLSQSAAAYLGLQILQAGYLDVMASAEGATYLPMLDGFGAAPGAGSGDLLPSVHAGTHPGLRSIHGCDGSYARVSSLLSYDCSGTNPLAASLSVAYQVLATPNGWPAHSLGSVFEPNRGFITDCGAMSPRAADTPTANPAGDVVINRFYLDASTGQLMCVGNGNPDAPVRLAGNIEQFQVEYGLPLPASGEAEAVARFVPAAVVDALGATAWSSVLSVQVCLLARGEPGSIDRASSGTNLFVRDCAGRPVSTRDGALRRAHRFVFAVRNSVRSAVSLP